MFIIEFGVPFYLTYVVAFYVKKATFSFFSLTRSLFSSIVDKIIYDTVSLFCLNDDIKFP